jgi:hypothetical protein
VIGALGREDDVVEDADAEDLAGLGQALGLSDLMLDFRRDDLGEMLEWLERVATQIRPALGRA